MATRNPWPFLPVLLLLLAAAANAALIALAHDGADTEIGAATAEGP
jgi:hypothetical protein